MPAINGKSTEPGIPGVLGESTQFNGVLGVSTANGNSGVAGIHDEGVGNGVYGRSKGGDGVQGFSSADGHAGVAGANDDGNGVGVYGRSAKQAGVYGESAAFNGVLGLSKANGQAGVAGVNESGGNGLYGRGNGNGVFGVHVGPDGSGITGTSDLNDGVRGFSMARDHAGVVGTNDGSGTGVLAQSPGGVGLRASGGFLAGFFQGDVEVTGDIRLQNADCAEDFDIVCIEQAEPGTVMVIDAEGALRPGDQAYDKRVAGVISGAGSFKPGLILDKRKSSINRMPIALLGKVYCKVDARYGAVDIGDLLTTSRTVGHAMKVTDAGQALGTIIGKALAPLSEGQGLIPILVTLQ